MRKAPAISLIVCLLCLPIYPALADDSDIFGANVKPNVMLAITSSTNMSTLIMTVAYSPSTTYSNPLTYTTTVVYKYVKSTQDCKPNPSPCYLLYANTIAQVPDADPPASPDAARTALSTGGYWNGSISGTTYTLFYGNYLNYTLCDPSVCGQTQSKLSVMQTVLTTLINNTSGVRFGSMTYSAGGGKMMDQIADMTAANKTQMVNDINAMTLQSSSNPIGSQLKSAGDYYFGNLTGLPSPIQYACQPNFVILFTDGYTKTSTDPTLEATALYTQTSSSTFPVCQNIITHVIAFDTATTPMDASTIQTLQQTAKNGGGLFFDAFNAAELESALTQTISTVLKTNFSFTTPVVPTTSTSGNSRAYMASFQSNPSRPDWRGYLKAYNRDANGLIPVDTTTNIPLDSALAWDAGQQLSTTLDTSRTIYTAINGALASFTTSDASITNAMMNASSTTEKNNIINFIRGLDTYDEDNDGNFNDQRPWKLGDIFHSTPVLVTPPSLPSSDPSYITFKTTSSVATRPTVLLSGANDGMLHATRESDGTELWGFVLPDLLDNVKDLTVSIGPHGFYVDGNPIAADVKIGTTPTWKTAAVFGERRGGRNYYALDITNTTNPLYMWSFTDSKSGESWSAPAIGKVKMADGTTKWVAFVGGGYDTANNNNTGKAFFVIDLSNGSKLWEYYNATGATDDRQYMNFSLASSPTAVDLDNDGFIDHVYIGDVGGQLWKFNVSAPATLSGGLVSNWTGKRVFVAAPTQANPPAAGEYYPSQAIYEPPALAYDASGNLWVFFGTGDRNHPMSTSTNRFYGFKDNPSDMTQGSYLTESSLVNRTSNTGTVTQGWYIVLASTEKVLAAANVFNNTVFFTSFTPATVVTCGAGGGTAKLYSINMLNGDAALNLANGTLLTPGQSALVNAKVIGTGIPSRPVIILKSSGSQGNASAITGTTDRQIYNTPLPPVSLKRLVGWREVF